MAENVTLAPVASFTNDSSAVATVNANNALIETAFSDCLSLTGGSPNRMQSNLDMNSNQILNLPAPATINSPARLIDVVANPTLALTIPPVGTSGATVPLLNSNVTWSGTSSFGTPFVQVFSYTGSSNSLITAVRGTTASPTTDGQATGIFQGVTNQTTGDAQTLYVSLNKRSSTAGIDNRGIFVEVVDNAGGGSIAGGRFVAVANAGTLSNATGITAVANTGINIPYSYLVGGEHQTFNNSGTDATTTLSPAKFAAGMLSTNAGTNCADAAYLVNPNAPATSGKGYISGFFVATNTLGAGLDTIIDTGFRCDASCVNGIDISRGTYSGSSIKAPNFTLSQAGNIVSNALTTNAVITATVAATSSIKSSSASAGIGYATGAGGTVTQATNKSTGVTLNKVTGQITMNAAALANSTTPTTGIATFVVSNSSVAATDTVIANISGGTTSLYNCYVTNIAAGSFWITVQNASGGSLSEALVINFNVIKGVAS